MLQTMTCKKIQPGYDPLVVPVEVRERFFRKLGDHTDTDLCWEWPHALNGSGYGIFKYQQLTLAHRFAYLAAYGTLTQGKFICHTCDNPKCCNPHHLIEGDALWNNRDKLRKGKQPRGITHGMSKVTHAKVIKIRMLGHKGVPQSKIAHKFNLTQSAISLILSRKRWGHIQ
jgi:hypothetical protein